ncbi:MAG: acyl carrier protein [Eubacterium sp.]|nr:acyl carrier protein [Eubacterium sp.]MDE6156264.1 acyl carrier protein [Eubacterium sp.]MDE6767007.1 acyl carrier protein [Eubacterium sp.]
MERLIELLETLKPNVTFTKDTRLVDDKIFDSLGMISLVAEIANEFDIVISPMEIVPENFETVETLYEMIEELIDED